MVTASLQECGYADVKDVETHELEDRMESFFLSETCKYLYLLFDDDNFIHQAYYVFNTGAWSCGMQLALTSCQRAMCSPPTWSTST